MPSLEIHEYATYETFSHDWDGPEKETRLLWHLLEQLDDDELLIKLPTWLAEQNTGYVNGSVPTVFIGRIADETEKAIRLADSADARSLMKLAHRIHNLEQREDDPDRDEWLNRKLRQHRREFQARDDAIPLSNEWLPKSQLQHVLQRA